jgi:hypothetical protein
MRHEVEVLGARVQHAQTWVQDAGEEIPHRPQRELVDGALVGQRRHHELDAALFGVEGHPGDPTPHRLNPRVRLTWSARQRHSPSRTTWYDGVLAR